MKIKSIIKIALMAEALLIMSYCFPVDAADWSKQVKSGKIISEGTITNEVDKEEINTILRLNGYTDLEVVGGDIAWVAPDSKGIRKIYFKANCMSNKGGNAIVEGWIDYFNTNKYKITKVYNIPK